MSNLLEIMPLEWFSKEDNTIITANWLIVEEGHIGASFYRGELQWLWHISFESDINTM